MAEGVRLVSVRRGVDPRRFALFAFGGAAGLHATEIARQLGLRRVIVPRVAAVLSAWGMLATDLRFEIGRTHIGDARALDGAAVKRLFEEMEAEAMARLRASGSDRAGFAGPARSERAVDMRYGEQVFEITVPLDDVDWSLPDPLPQIVELFHRRHEALYTYAMPDQESVLVNARVAVSGILEELPQEPASAGSPGRSARRRAADLPRGLGHRAGLPLRCAGRGTDHRRARDHRIGDDDGAAAPRRRGAGDRAGLARHRGAGSLTKCRSPRRQGPMGPPRRGSGMGRPSPGTC